MPRPVVEREVRCRTQYAYLGSKIGLSRVLGRYKLFVDTDDIGFASHIILDGFWEIWLTQFTARHVKPGMTVIDIGANFGYYSVLLADLITESGSCICIEANPRVADRLRDSLSINGFSRRSRVVACAVGDGASPNVHFFVPDHEPKNARILVGTDSDTEPPNGNVIEVPSTSVDAICKDIQHVDFIKIDAEGAEALIWRGMTGLLERSSPDIILEFNYLRYADPQTFISDIRAYYSKLRYLDFDGLIKDVSAEALGQRNLGEDWLLFLSNH